MRKNFFYIEGGRGLEQAAQGGNGISFLKTFSRQLCVVTCSRWTWLGRRVGLDDLHWFLPKLSILWFSDSVKYFILCFDCCWKYWVNANAQIAHITPGFWSLSDGWIYGLLSSMQNTFIYTSGAFLLSRNLEAFL